MNEFEFWYNIMRDCESGALICGVLTSIVSIIYIVGTWIETNKFYKRYLIIPVTIIILGFCYYIGMERLLFEVKGPC